MRRPAEDRQRCGDDKAGWLIKSVCGTQDASHTWQPDYVNPSCGEMGGFRRGKHSAALFHNINQDARMAVHGDDLVYLSDEDGLDALLKAQYTAKVMGTFGFEDSVAKRLLAAREFDFVPPMRAARYLVEKPKSALTK